MKLREVIVCLAALLLSCMPLGAVRAYPGVLTFTQPDGSKFRARIIGDEFFNYIRTEDGCIVMRDAASGYYCYATVTPEGKKVCSSVRYGAPVSAEILAGSRAALKRPESARRPVRSLPQMGERLHKSSKEKRSVIFVPFNFSDLSFSYPQQRFVDLITKTGYSTGGATGSVKDYFQDQLGDYIDFSFDVAPLVTLSKGYKYYGEDDENGDDLHPDEAVREACRLSDDAVDFSKYDNIFLIYAGGNPADYSADDDHIWPHMGGISLSLDGKTFSEYALTSELQIDEEYYYTTGEIRTAIAGIGTFCHEYSHTLGLDDYYDTDYEDSGGQSRGLWSSLSLMDGGNYNNLGRTPPNYSAIDYMWLGFGVQKLLTVGTLKLEPINVSHTYYLSETDYPGEYYLFEVRDNSSGWDRYIGGRGMLIYHLDQSGRDAGYSKYFDENYNMSSLTAAQRWMYNEINANPAHECAQLVVPGRPELAEVSYSHLFFGGEYKSFGPSTTPSFAYWSGAVSALTLSNITRLTSGNVQFRVTGPIVLDNVESFQDAAVITWHSAGEQMPMAFFCNGDSTAVSPVGGVYAKLVTGLAAATDYTASIRFGLDPSSPVFTVNFTTKAAYPGNYPYIYMGSVEKTITGAVKAGSKIPLRVFNAMGVDRVDWYLDGTEISVGWDGYYTINHPGLLRAEVHYLTGMTEVIVKELVLR